MEWYEAVEELSSHLVQITTPRGSGTGFFVYRSTNPDVCAIATAAHVIDHAHYWEQPIRIRTSETDDTVLLRPEDRAIVIDPDKDTAVILFEPHDLKLPTVPQALIKEGYIQRVGTTIGWLGFPAMAASTVCFFSGTISAWHGENDAYLVDGVAINGVSGGPAFGCYDTSLEIIGVVSAYIPNRATGETLPGLALVRDVSHLQEVVQRFKSLDEAKAEEGTPTEPPIPPPSPPSPGV